MSLCVFWEVDPPRNLAGKSRTTWETRSNQDGIAKIPQIPKGKIRIQVNAKGYQTFGQDFQVEEDERTLEIKMNPPQPQYSVRSDVRPARFFQQGQRTAIASISTSVSSGSLAASMVARAGGSVGKNREYTSFIFLKSLKSLR